MIMPLNMNVLYKHTSQLTHRAYICGTVIVL